MTLNSTSAVVTDLVVVNREEWKDALAARSLRTPDCVRPGAPQPTRANARALVQPTASHYALGPTTRPRHVPHQVLHVQMVVHSREAVKWLHSIAVAKCIGSGSGQMAIMCVARRTPRTRRRLRPYCGACLLNTQQRHAETRLAFATIRRWRDFSLKQPSSQEVFQFTRTATKRLVRLHKAVTLMR
jgi:hypothetical protein